MLCKPDEVIIKKQLQELLFSVKSGRPDLNRGPHAPEACALTELRYAPLFSQKQFNDNEAANQEKSKYNRK